MKTTVLLRQSSVFILKRINVILHQKSARNRNMKSTLLIKIVPEVGRTDRRTTALKTTRVRFCVLGERRFDNHFFETSLSIPNKVSLYRNGKCGGRRLKTLTQKVLDVLQNTSRVILNTLSVIKI